MQRFPSLSSANIFLDDSLDDSHEEKEEIDLLETPLESRPTPFAMSRHHRTRHLPLRRQLRWKGEEREGHPAYQTPIIP